MKIKLQAPKGTSVLTIADDATVGELQKAISEKTSISVFDLKFGFPPQALDLTAFAPSLSLEETGLRLKGQQLIVIDKEIQEKLSHPVPKAPSSTSQDQIIPGSSAGANDRLPSLKRAPNSLNDPPEIAVPSHQATMVLRVMPDDNSCFFRAFSSAVLSDSLDVMRDLRRLVAQTIQEAIQKDPSSYPDIVLDGKTPERYCRWIQDKDSWGGDVELAILSRHYNLEVSVISVIGQNVVHYNRFSDIDESIESERKQMHSRRRIILVWSGIHYDTMALSPSDPPHTQTDMPADLDIKQFDDQDDIIVHKAKEFCKILQDRGYGSDMSSMLFKCNNCDWIGQGETQVTQHCAETGHLAIEEIKDLA